MLNEAQSINRRVIARNGVTWQSVELSFKYQIATSCSTLQVSRLILAMAVISGD